VGPTVESVELTAGSGVQIAPLDPLRADDVLGRLPDWNKASDAKAIAQALSVLVPSKEQLEGMSLHESAAALRDLGMLLSSLRRHGVQPCEAVPQVVPVLLALGRRCEMVPRDTVYHYGPWNPTGSRQRRFTRDPNEDGLIHCVRSAAPGVERAIFSLQRARDSEPGSTAFMEGCAEGARATLAMVHAINFARQHVDVAFFAGVLRHYFEPIVVDGRTYLGPAAAHLPLCVVDHLSWGSDEDDATYSMFMEDASRYTVARWREAYRDMATRPSLSTRVTQAIATSEVPNRPLFETAAALYTLLRVLLIFRGRHKVLADKAYDPKTRHYPVGSGGFSTEAVDQILEVTRARAAALRKAVKEKHGLSVRPRPSVVADA
jgi:hypothetical protein